MTCALSKWAQTRSCGWYAHRSPQRNAAASLPTHAPGAHRRQTLSPAADRRSGSFFFDREPRRNAMPLSGTAPSDSVKARLWAFCAHKFLWDFDPDRAFDYDAALTALKTRAHLLASDMQLESAGVVRSDEGREQA